MQDSLAAMSRTVVAEAIVLAVRDTTHADRSVILFSREQGKIRALAHGARMSKSRLGGCLQPFSAVCVSLTEAIHQPPVITQCEVRQSFREIRENIERFSYGSLLAELTNELWLEGDRAPEVYKTLQGAFSNLTNRNPRLTALACGWKLLDLAGLGPQYDTCLTCGSEVSSEAGFSPHQGGALCSLCKDDSLPSFSPATANLLSTLLNLDWKAPGEFRVNEKTLCLLENLFQSYVTCHLAKELKSFAFIRQMTSCPS